MMTKKHSLILDILIKSSRWFQFNRISNKLTTAEAFSERITKLILAQGPFPSKSNLFAAAE